MTGWLPHAVDALARAHPTQIPDQSPTDGRDVLALVSGGHDSLAAMHVAHRSPDVSLDGVAHINTGIGIDDIRNFVRERAEDLGLAFHEVGAPESHNPVITKYRYETEEYMHLIERYGFPGPAAHRWMYLNLKEKPLQRWLADHYPDREVVLVSGVRRHESRDRMENVAADGRQDFLGCPTVSPIADWTGLDVCRYRRELELPMNPVV